MATTVNDFIEMDVLELCDLYEMIYNNSAQTKIVKGELLLRHKTHDLPTLNIMREIILQKCTGEQYNSYREIVEAVDGSDYDSVNRYPLSRSIILKVYRNKLKYGITDRLTKADFNSHILLK